MLTASDKVLVLTHMVVDMDINASCGAYFDRVPVVTALCSEVNEDADIFRIDAFVKEENKMPSFTANIALDAEKGTVSFTQAGILAFTEFAEALGNSVLVFVTCGEDEGDTLRTGMFRISDKGIEGFDGGEAGQRFVDLMEVDDPEEVEFWDTTSVPSRVSDAELMGKMRKDLLRQEEIVDEAVATFADLPQGSVMLLDQSIVVMKCSHSASEEKFFEFEGCGSASEYCNQMGLSLEEYAQLREEAQVGKWVATDGEFLTNNEVVLLAEDNFMVVFGPALDK